MIRTHCDRCDKIIEKLNDVVEIEENIDNKKYVFRIWLRGVYHKENDRNLRGTHRIVLCENCLSEWSAIYSRKIKGG